MKPKDANQQHEPRLVCTECGKVADERAHGWRAYFTHEKPPNMAVFCPECARREFGDKQVL